MFKRIDRSHGTFLDEDSPQWVGVAIQLLEEHESMNFTEFLAALGPLGNGVNKKAVKAYNAIFDQYKVSWRDKRIRLRK